MVWDNLKRKDAAEKAGLADSSLRFVFRKPHVMAYYHAELAALRNNLKGSNVQRVDAFSLRCWWDKAEMRERRPWR
jgi:hypothetical protein